MLHLENFFEKSFALLLTTPISFFWNTKNFTPSADLWYDKSKRRFHLGH